MALPLQNDAAASEVAAAAVAIAGQTHINTSEHWLWHVLSLKQYKAFAI